jgi:ubiquinone/menaquinone biosynthesis C-methylase UbiE
MDDTNRLIQQQFGAHANDYVTSAIHAQGESLARLVKLTQPQRNWRVLDVSTGAGHTALAFAPHVARVIACDLTPEMLDAARALAKERGIMNIEFKPADALALPFDDNTFDLVTNRLALHHYSDARKAVEEMARVCKRGGIVALADNVVPPDKVTAGYINHFEKCLNQ